MNPSHLSWKIIPWLSYQTFIANHLIFTSYGISTLLRVQEGAPYPVLSTYVLQCVRAHWINDLSLLYYYDVLKESPSTLPVPMFIVFTNSWALEYICSTHIDMLSYCTIHILKTQKIMGSKKYVIVVEMILCTMCVLIIHPKSCLYSQVQPPKRVKSLGIFTVVSNGEKSSHANASKKTGQGRRWGEG
jgi:hypothetical protein